MKIEANKEILVIRFTQYKNVDFIDEHSKIVKEKNSVWILKVGRMIPQKSIERVIGGSKVVVLKAPKKAGGKYYIASIKGYHNGLPKSGFDYPKYYDEMLDSSYEYTLEGTWICVETIQEIDDSILDHLLMEKNRNRLVDVINSTRTSVLYAISDEELDIVNV